MDCPVAFHGQFGPGLYYVETAQYFPMRGNGWYYEPTVKYCLENKMITEDQIKYVIHSTSSLSGDFFNDFINYVYSRFGEFSKLAINSMIGCFKPKDKENHELLIPPTTDVNVCFHHLLEDHGTNIYAFDVDQTMYYAAFRSHTVTQEETEAPFYHMVLEQEAIELHKLSKVIENAGGLVLDLSTDAVTCVFKSKELPFKTVTQDDRQMIFGLYYENNGQVFKCR